MHEPAGVVEICTVYPYSVEYPPPPPPPPPPSENCLRVQVRVQNTPLPEN